jgi:DNA-binding transcriptional LysR family regulator
MELRHIRYVLTAAEHGSFHRAAAALSVKQSVVSRRIRDLEDGLGACLFVRQHTGVVLT